MPLSSKLIVAIWACAREHGISKDEVHDAIHAGFQKTSVKHLVEWEALRLLDGMRGKRSEGHGPYERRLAMRNHGRRDVAAGGTDYLVNETELGILRGIAKVRGMTDEGLRTFCQRQLGLDQPRTMKEYNRVLWAIKAMIRRDAPPKEDDHAA